MKHTRKHNAGFTLVELVVAIAMATIVTAAATSVLLMGLRINRQTGDTASQQITVRSLLSVMENAAADGNITAVESDFVDENNKKKYGSWALKGEDGKAIFHYDADEQTIYTNAVPVLEGVFASNAIMEGQLLSISIETKDGTYTSAVYCRTATPGEEVDTDNLPGTVGNDARGKFIEILKSQYRSRGEILDANGNSTGVYYSEWYIVDYETNPGWNEKTPWCACYISWALSQVTNAFDSGKLPEDRSRQVGGVTEYYWYANVDDFIAYFKTSQYGSNGQSWFNRGEKTPTAGDLIFFDWDKGTDPEHVGVVLSVDGNMVYTIEGNSAGRVAIRSYLLTDERIIGYGVLSWSN